MLKDVRDVKGIKTGIRINTSPDTPSTSVGILLGSWYQVHSRLHFCRCAVFQLESGRIPRRRRRYRPFLGIHCGNRLLLACLVLHWSRRTRYANKWLCCNYWQLFATVDVGKTDIRTIRERRYRSQHNRIGNDTAHSFAK